MLFLCLLTFFSFFAYLTFTVSHYACSISTGDKKKSWIRKNYFSRRLWCKTEKKMRNATSTTQHSEKIKIGTPVVVTSHYSPPQSIGLDQPMFLPWLGDLKKSLTTLEASLYKLELTWAPQGHPLHYLELWCRSGLNPPFKWESSQTSSSYLSFPPFLHSLQVAVTSALQN